MQAVTIADYGLNERQAAFARQIAEGANFVTVAERLGYDRATAYRLTADPSVVAAIEAELHRLLRTEGAPIAYRVAKEMLQDTKVGGPTRAMLVKTVFDRAGFVPPAADKDPASGRPINELTSS
jgi:hypothetical protein